MLKKVDLRVLLTVCAAIGAMAVVSACGSNDNSSTGSSSGSASGGKKPAWCGDKQATLALADGFGDNNWRRITTAEAKDEAAKCPSVKKASCASPGRRL